MKWPVVLRHMTVALTLAVALPAAHLGAATLDDANALAGPAPGSVTGKVMDAAGRPIQGVKVALRLGESSSEAVTDAQGEYCFCRVKPARNYVFEIEKDGFTGFIERDFAVAKARISIRNVIIDPLSSPHPVPGNGDRP